MYLLGRSNCSTRTTLLSGLMILVASILVVSLSHAPASADALDDYLVQWAANGKADEQMVNGIFQTLDITKKDLEDRFLERVKTAGAGYSGGESAFVNEVRETLDKARYNKVDSALKRVVAEFGDDLEVVVRTGSSGLRHMQLNGKGDAASGYRLLFSDDDISFVGNKAIAASDMFNKIVRDEGLDRIKVKGFDLIHLRDVRQIDLIALDILDPEKFLGESGLGSIKGEMLEKGAVVAQSSEGAMQFTAQPLKAFVEAKKGRMLADILDEKAFREAVKKYGSLTMVASCERQITDAHGGWGSLTDPDKAKYVLRQRLALAESGALEKIGGMSPGGVQAELAKLRGLKAAKELVKGEVAWLESLRFQNAELAFAEIPLKMEPIIAAAEAKGTSIAGNPEIRKAINELTTAWTLLESQVMPISEEKVLASFKRTAGGNDTLYKMLYTSYQESKDLLDTLDHWVKSGGTRESFFDMLIKLKDRPARLAAVKARLAKKAPTPEAGALKAFEEMLGTDLGDTFVVKMAKNPTARKMLAATMAATGGGVVCKKMYDSWMQGTAQEDLSDAAFALVDFVPGGMSFKRAATEGVDVQTTFMFAKEALYFTPAWPLVLAGDLAYVAVEIGSAVQTSKYHEGLIDVLVYNGEFDPSGKFLRLNLPNPGGRIIEMADLKPFLFETKAVTVKQAAQGMAYIISDLSQATNDIYDKYYLANDPAMQQLRLAADQQLNEINEHEAWKSLDDPAPFAKQVAFAKWLVGYDGVQKDSPEKWYKVFLLLKGKMIERRERVAADVMVPHLVQLAEQKRGTLDAPNALADKIAKLQEEFKKLRGTALEVSLVEEVKKNAAAKAKEKEDSREVKEVQALAAGEYWQQAHASYQQLFNVSKDIKADISRKTGYGAAEVLRFGWTGDHTDDLRRAMQSKQGFASELAKINRDIRAAKGNQPDLSDAVDKQAFGVLSRVVCFWRVTLDEDDTAVPSEGSQYFEDYGDALESVKALYVGSAELQAQIEKGVQLYKEKDSLLLDKPTTFEVKVLDPTLKQELDNKDITLKWTADPKCAITPDDTSLSVKVWPNGPQPVTVTATFSRGGAKNANASVSVLVPVKVPDNFLLLSLKPTIPKPNEMIGAEAGIPDRFLGGDNTFHYAWSGAGCRVDDFDKTRTVVTAPASGEASVTVALLIEGRDGKSIKLASRTLKFSVLEPNNDDAKAKAKAEADALVAKIKADMAKQAAEAAEMVAANEKQKAESDALTAEIEALAAKTKAEAEAPGADPKSEDLKGGSLFDALAALSRAEAAKMTAVADRMDAEAKVADAGLKPRFEALAAEARAAAAMELAKADALDSQARDADEKGIAHLDDKTKAALAGATAKARTAAAEAMAQADTLATEARVAEAKAKAPADAPAAEGSASVTPAADGIKAKLLNLEGKTVYGTKGKLASQVEPEDGAADVEAQSAAEIEKAAADKAKAEVAAKRVAAAKSEAANIAALEQDVAKAKALVPEDYFEVDRANRAIALYKYTIEKKWKDLEGNIRGAIIADHVVGKPQPQRMIIWQSEPGLTFDPAKSPDGNTTVTYNRVGKVKMWTEIQEMKDGVYKSVGETKQVEIDVVPPNFTITFSPETAKIGMEVKAVIKTDPLISHELLNYVWSSPESSNRMEYGKDGSVIGFKLKDANPVVLKVEARVPFYGDTLNENITATFTPSLYLMETKVTGAKPQIWKEGVGLVDVENGYAVDQNVVIRAEFVGEKPPGEVRYQWTVNEGTTLASSGLGTEITVSRHEVGSMEAKVQARDPEGVPLCSATAIVAITVSQAELDKGKEK